MATKKRTYYEKLFIDYPDVVELPMFCEMMGGIGDSTARRLLRANLVSSFNIPHHNGHRYMIPKEYIIDYILSEHYAEYKHSLKVQV